MAEFPATYIYTLSDPRDGMVRYVGKTISVSKRRSEHFSGKGKTRNAIWVRRLKRIGLLPVFEIIDECRENWEVVERSYIRLYKSFGAKLNNHADGGGGSLGYKLTEEQKKRLSAALKGKKKTESHTMNAKAAAKIFWDGDSEEKKKNNERILAFNDLPEHRNKILVGQRNRRKLTDSDIKKVIFEKENKICSYRCAAKRHGIDASTLSYSVTTYKNENGLK